MASEADAEYTEHEHKQARYKWERHSRLQYDAEGSEYTSGRLYHESKSAESDGRNVPTKPVSAATAAGGA